MFEHSGLPLYPPAGFSYSYRKMSDGQIVFPIPKNASKSIIAASVPTPARAGALAFIRDPFERLRSLFDFIVNGGFNEHLEWERFIDLTLNGHVDAHSLPQSRVICDGYAKQLYRYEDLETMFPGLPHLNESLRTIVSLNYRYAELKEFYAEDIKLRKALA